MRSWVTVRAIERIVGIAAYKVRTAGLDCLLRDGLGLARSAEGHIDCSGSANLPAENWQRSATTLGSYPAIILSMRV
jgi:hypothetical protein